MQLQTIQSNLFKSIKKLQSRGEKNPLPCHNLAYIGCPGCAEQTYQKATSTFIFSLYK